MLMMPPEPIPPEPNFSIIPEAMREARRWVMWRYEFNNDKWTKVPWNINYKASSTNPDTWLSLEEAYRAYSTGKYAGVGFVLGWDKILEKNWLGVDLDKVYDPDTETWSMPEWRDMVYRLNTYTEFSPSGKGIHAIGWGAKEGDKCKKATETGDLEFYDNGRYFTVTGRRIEAVTNPQVGDVNTGAVADLEAVIGKVDRKPKSKKTAYYAPPEKGVVLTDAQKEKLPKPDEIVKRIKNSNAADEFIKLYDKGDFSKYESRSHAVYALIGMIHWWTRDVPTTFMIMTRAAVIDQDKWARLGLKEVRKIDNETIFTNFPPWVDDSLKIPITENVPRIEDKDDIKNMKFEINVPEDHFISKYVDHWVGRNDAYPDYHFASALSMLSIAADRIIGVPTKNMGMIRTNLWILMLGVSSFSRKTTALRPVRRFTYVGEGKLNTPVLNQLPDTFTPESLIEDLAENQKAFHLKDECAQILSGMNKKTYMVDLRDLFCSLYDGDPFSRKLRTKVGQSSYFRADNPYLSMQWATTPDNFYKSTSILDATSGFLLRFLPVFPQYPKEIMGIEIGNPDIDKVEEKLAREYEQIVLMIHGHTNINAIPSNSGMKAFNDWFITKQKYYEYLGDEYKIHQSALARIIPNVLKIAANLTIGDPRFADWIQIDTHSKVSVMIPDEYIEEGIRLVDEYFLPVLIEIMINIERRGVENIQERIINHLKSATGYRVLWSDMMRKIRAPNKKAFADAVEFLEESNEVVIGEEGEGKAHKKFIQLIVKEK